MHCMHPIYQEGVFCCNIFQIIATAPPSARIPRRASNTSATSAQTPRTCPAACMSTTISASFCSSHREQEST